MARFLTIWLFIVFLSFNSAFAEEKSGSTQQPQTLQEINKKEAQENVSNRIQELANLLMEGAKKKYNDCLKAFGDHEFCQCIQNKTPSSITFAEYIAIVITPKENLGYSEADEDTKGIIDNALKARETCVAANK